MFPLSPLESWALILTLVALPIALVYLWHRGDQAEPVPTEFEVALERLRRQHQAAAAEIGRALLPPMQAAAVAFADFGRALAAVRPAGRPFDWQNDDPDLA